MGKIIIIVFLFIIGLVIFSGFSKYQEIDNAKTPEQLQAVCTQGYYANTDLRNLPVKCLQFYQSPIK